MYNKPFFWRFLLALALVLGALTARQGAAQSPTGQWEYGPDFPYFPVHIHLLPNGTVMMWPGDGGVSGDDPRVWDPVSGAITPLGKPGYDTFCAGHSFLPDGRLFVAGGHIGNFWGLSEAAIYDPVANTWTRQAQMNDGRWYPTTTTLPNGDVLVVSGQVDHTIGVNTLPQVWESATGNWRNLTNAMLGLPLYPYMFLAPNGKVFNAGPGMLTRYLDTSGTGTWSDVAFRVAGGVRDYGSAVMYAPGKILTMGGNDPPTNTAEVIDLNAASPAWREVGSMTYPRRQINATMLPDGKVLVTGGSRAPGFSNGDPGHPVFAAELWDPATESWTLMAESAPIPRLYHSVALLLPDARVVVAGGNGYTQSEIFSPPYLFTGPRPTISSAPSVVGSGQSFFVGTPNAAAITEVSWISLPSITHTNNMSQGFYRSTAITQASEGITIVAPNHTSVPPGYYMLFLLQNGVPSVATIVRLAQSAPPNPAPSLTSLAPTSAIAGGPEFTLTLNGSNFVSTSQVRWKGSDRPTTFVSPTRLTAVIGASDIPVAGTAQVTVFNPTPGGGTSAARTFTIRNPVPTLVSMSQNSARAGGPAFTLTVNGSNFVSTSKVRWNGSNRTTTFVSASQLTATIRATDLAAAGTAQVTVFNPTPGGGTSAVQTFTINPPPAPTLSSITPTSATAGGAAFTLTANGSDFVSASTVRWNGADRPTTYVSRTQLRASIPASDIAARGTATVNVFTAAPGGGTSAARSFQIN